MYGTGKLIQKKSQIICLVFLLLYPFWHCNVGIDLMDAGYGLGNFTFFQTMDQNWKLATYLSNVLGHILTKLPGGSIYLGMNLYCAALLSLTAAASYLFLVRVLGHPYLFFWGEWIALSLCWAPKTILYHYLGYYLLTICVLLLETAIRARREKYFWLAGLLLGISIFVRLPNVTHMACILIVWYDAFFLNKEERFHKALKNTFRCLAGYAIGVGIPFSIICLKYGFQAYLQMLHWLFGMTDTATDYKPTSMLTAMFGDYIQYASWLVLLLLYLFAGILLFKVFEGKWEKTKKILYIIGSMLLIRFFYGRGMFGISYTSYFAVYKWIVVFLLVYWILAIFVLLQKKEWMLSLGLTEAQTDTCKRLAVAGMVIVFVTPLGSNNGLYPIINNLFLVAPLTILFLRFFVLSRENTQKKKDVSSKTSASFAYRVMACLLICCISIQSILFGLCFTFHDTAEGKIQRRSISLIPALKYMSAEQNKADNLESLYLYLKYNNLLDREIVLYGDIPAVSYCLKMKPAIFTTWPDLGSNLQSQLKNALNGLEKKMKKGKREPVFILSAEIDNEDPKREMIQDFLYKNGYDNTYRNSEFWIYECNP